MKVFVAILVVVGAAAAASISEEQQQLQQEQLSRESIAPASAPIVESNFQNAKTNLIGGSRFFNVFTAPLASREFLPMEKFGTMGLFEKPMIVAFKPDNQKEMFAFLLRGGLKGLFFSPETQLVENYLMTGAKKVGLMMSAARFLDLPEMSLVMPKISLPSDSSLNHLYRLSQDTSVVPVMLIVEDRLPAIRKDALFDLGQFSMNKDFIKITHEVLPKFLPEVKYGKSLIPASEYEFSAPSSELYPKQNFKIRAEQPYLQNYEYSAFPKVYKNAANQYIPVYETAIPHAEQQSYLQNYESSAFPKVYKNAANQYVHVYETAIPHSEQPFLQSYKPSLQRAEPFNAQSFESIPRAHHVHPESIEFEEEFSKPISRSQAISPAYVQIY